MVRLNLVRKNERCGKFPIILYRSAGRHANPPTLWVNGLSNAYLGKYPQTIQKRIVQSQGVLVCWRMNIFQITFSYNIHFPRIFWPAFRVRALNFGSKSVFQVQFTHQKRKLATVITKNGTQKPYFSNWGATRGAFHSKLSFERSKVWSSVIGCAPNKEQYYTLSSPVYWSDQLDQSYTSTRAGVATFLTTVWLRTPFLWPAFRVWALDLDPKSVFQIQFTRQKRKMPTVTTKSWATLMRGP